MSRIALGLMRISELNVDQVEQLISNALDNGINFFDLADIYGNGRCEELLGLVLKKNPSLRKRMYIQTKIGIRKNPKRYDLSYDYIIQAVNDCLKRLQLDYIDCLLLHRPDIFMDCDEVASAISYLIKQGLIRDFGVSNFSSSEIAYLSSALDVKIKYNQLQLGVGNTLMVDQTMYTNLNNSYVTKDNDDLFFYLKKEKIIVQCWSPYFVGFFEGSIFDEEKYPVLNQVLEKYANRYNTSKCAIATAFLLKLDKNLLVITGSTNIEHIKESLDGEKINLSREDWYSLYNEIGHKVP